MIKVRKIGVVYLAEASPPHAKRRWKSLLPMNAQRTLEGLIRHGVSLPDAFAALSEADPYGVDHALG